MELVEREYRRFDVLQGLVRFELLGVAESDHVFELQPRAFHVHHVRWDFLPPVLW